MSDGIHIDGLPHRWYTNMSPEDVRIVYSVLRDDPDFVVSGVHNIGWSIQVKLFCRMIPFNDGACQCFAVGDTVWLTYRTAQEWEVWKAHKAERTEHEEAMEDSVRADIAMFNTTDEHLAKLIATHLATRSFEAIPDLLRQLVHLRHANEHIRFQVHDRWEFDAIDILSSITTPTIGISYLASTNAEGLDYYWLGDSYFYKRFREVEARLAIGRDPDWRRKVLSHEDIPRYFDEAETIYLAGIDSHRCDVALFEQICLFYDHEDRLDKALHYCTIAIERGLDDGTKTGFRGRLKRLESKRKRMHNKGAVLTVDPLRGSSAAHP